MLLERINTRFGTWRGLVRLLLAHLEHRAGRLNGYETVDWERVDRLVFVCLGNVCRSPFGDVVARTRGLPSASIGLSTTTGAPANDLGAALATERGFDLSAHEALDLRDYVPREGDLLLMMEVRHARYLERWLHERAPDADPGSRPPQIALLGFWSTPPRPHIHDPLTLSDDYFRTCHRVIESAVEGLEKAWPGAARR